MQSYSNNTRENSRLSPLVRAFIAVLETGLLHAIWGLWDATPELQAEIKDLSYIDAVMMLQTVFGSARGTTNHFLIAYLNKIDKREVIETYLLTLKNNFISDRLMEDKILLLELHIETLRQQEILQRPPVRAIAVTTMTEQNQQAIWDNITFIDIIKNFEDALSSRNPNRIRTEWDETQLLRDWCAGKLIANRRITIDLFGVIFTRALESKCIYVIKQMWDNNPEFKYWISNKVIPVNQNNPCPSRAPITLEEAISFFWTALSSNSAYAISEIWKGSVLLQNWAKSRYVNYATLDKPLWDVISDNNLINLFKAVLATENSEIALEIWMSNTHLQDLIKGLDNSEAESMLSLLVKNHVGSKLVPEYIKVLSDIDVMRVFLWNLQQKPKPRSIQRVIILLDNRLEELNGVRLSNNSLTTLMPLVTNGVFAPANSTRKRRAPSKRHEDSSSNKQSRNEHNTSPTASAYLHAIHRQMDGDIVNLDDYANLQFVSNDWDASSQPYTDRRPAF